jgi:hypothetical protein
LPSVPSGGVSLSLTVPAATGNAQILAIAPSIGLVALANGTVGGERGSDGSGMDPNDPAQYAAIARSMVTTSVIVATISPSWVAGRDLGQSAPETRDTAELAAEEAGPDDVRKPAAESAAAAGVATRIDELFTWLGEFVPEFLGLRAGERRLASTADDPVVVPCAQAVEAEIADSPTAAEGDVRPGSAGGEVALATDDRGWLVLFSATSVAAIVYARRRVAGRRGQGLAMRPEPGRRRLWRTSTLKTALGALPRPSFARLQTGSQQACPTVRTNAGMRE